MKKGWGLQNSRSRMIALFIVDMLTVVLDSYLAIILRFKLDNIWVPEEYMSSVEHYMIINVITTVIIFLLLNLYNRVWSYASLYEMLLIVCAAMLSTAFQAFGFSLLYSKKLLFLLLYFAQYYYVDHSFFISDFAHDAEWNQKISEAFP